MEKDRDINKNMYVDDDSDAAITRDLKRQIKQMEDALHRGVGVFRDPEEKPKSMAEKVKEARTKLKQIRKNLREKEAKKIQLPTEWPEHPCVEKYKGLVVAIEEIIDSFKGRHGHPAHHMLEVLDMAEQALEEFGPDGEA